VRCFACGTYPAGNLESSLFVSVFAILRSAPCLRYLTTAAYSERSNQARRLSNDPSVAHGSVAHGSVAHGSVAHGSVAHGSMAHGSVAHGSVAHGGGDATIESPSPARGSAARDWASHTDSDGKFHVSPSRPRLLRMMYATGRLTPHAPASALALRPPRCMTR
jgi:hypothetical protein